jgi:hypothetical protein
VFFRARKMTSTKFARAILLQSRQLYKFQSGSIHTYQANLDAMVLRELVLRLVNVTERLIAK